LLQSVFGSAVTTSGIAAIVMTLVLPESMSTADKESQQTDETERHQPLDEALTSKG
jgi:xanthine permease XanP